MDMMTWCQGLLATDRIEDKMAEAMILYVRKGIVDPEMLSLESYATFRRWADDMGLVYEPIALTALRGMAMVPQEGRIFLTLFRYIQLMTGKCLTAENFIEFFGSGTLSAKNMQAYWNPHYELVDSFEWETAEKFPAN